MDTKTFNKTGDQQKFLIVFHKFDQIRYQQVK